MAKVLNHIRTLAGGAVAVVPPRSAAVADSSPGQGTHEKQSKHVQQRVDASFGLHLTLSVRPLLYNRPEGAFPAPSRRSVLTPPPLVPAPFGLLHTHIIDHDICVLLTLLFSLPH